MSNSPTKAGRRVLLAMEMGQAAVYMFNQRTIQWLLDHDYIVHPDMFTLNHYLTPKARDYLNGYHRRQFVAMMKKSGWQRVSGPGFGFVHTNGKRYEGDNMDTEERRQVISWRDYYEAGQTPPPF